jgi:hypothetical protein
MSRSRRFRAGRSHPATARPEQCPLRPACKIAATVAVALVLSGLAVITSQSAGAAAPPNAQSVGRFLDGAVGGKPIQQLADVKDARAVAPGTTSAQNPLDVTLLGSLELPLTGALQLPALLGINLGAANQVAVAHADGFSYGAAGAIANSGGVSVGGNNAAFPANATVDLSASGISGNAGVPIPGGTGSADALGGVKVGIGAVSALAQTPTGVAEPGKTNYNIADIQLQLSSPLLGGILGTVSSSLSTVLGALSTAAGGVPLPPACAFTAGFGSNLPLEGGAITLDASTASLTISLQKLLERLGMDLNNLAPNTDLLDLLLHYLSSPGGLAAAVQGLIDGLTNPLSDKFTACLNALGTSGPIGAVAGLLLTLTNALNSGKTTLQNTINGIVGGLAGSAGTSPLAPLGIPLKKLIDIGVNVQPNGPGGTFASKLRATPNQATPVVAGQTIVRAIEVNLLGNQLATLALANAAAGPSAATAIAPSTPSTAPVSGDVLPIAVPAGLAKPTGSPELPLALLTLGLLLAASGAVAWQVRGRHTR